MAKAVALIAFALGLLAIAGNVQGFYTSDGKFVKENKFDLDPRTNRFSVEGNFFCATCKVISETDIQRLGTASPQLVQPNKKVSVVASPDPRCNVKVPGFRSVRITLGNYKENGANTLYVKKPLGFLNNEALPNCRKVRSKSGVDLEIKCRSRKNGTVTLVKPALSDSTGIFTAYVEDGHHDDLCMVRAVASRDPRCNVKAPGFRSARITVANYNAKVTGNMLQIEKRMLFLNNEALPNCGKARSKEGNLYSKRWA
ncbi:hypothetical protein C3L33_11730, partial [Rhododendron williamsianum]